MRTFYSLAFALLLASCRTTEPAASQHQHATEHRPDTGKPAAPGVGYVQQQIAESTKAESTEKPGLFRRLFPKSESTKTVSSTAPRKCKNCIIVDGNGNTVVDGPKKVVDGAYSWEAAATNAGKKATQATDSAVLQQAGGNAANIPGDGNTTTQVKQDTTQEAPGWQATLAGRLGYVLAAAAVAGLCWAVWRAWPLLKRRKETSEPPTA